MQETEKHHFQIEPEGQINVYTLPPPITKLLLGGAGACGPGHATVYEKLKKSGMLNHLKEVGGSSAGALMAVLIATGYEPDEIIKQIKKFKLSTLLDINPKGEQGILKTLQNAIKNWTSPGQGIFRGDVMENEIKKLINVKIEEKLKNYLHNLPVAQRNTAYDDLMQKGIILDYKEGRFTLNPELNFTHFDHLTKSPYTELGIKNPYLTVTRVNDPALEILSHKHKEKTPVWKAVRASMSLPFFKMVEIEGKYYMDGGCYLNNPTPRIVFGDARPHDQHLDALMVNIDDEAKIKDFWQKKTWTERFIARARKIFIEPIFNRVAGVDIYTANRASTAMVKEHFSQRVIKVPRIHSKATNPKDRKKIISSLNLNVTDLETESMLANGSEVGDNWVKQRNGEVLTSKIYASLEKMSREDLKEFSAILSQLKNAPSTEQHKKQLKKIFPARSLAEIEILLPMYIKDIRELINARETVRFQPAITVPIEPKDTETETTKRGWQRNN